MDLRTPFINEFGRLRSGWRLIIYVVLFVTLNFLAATVVRIAYAIAFNRLPTIPHAEYLSDFTFRCVLLVLALISGYVCTRFLEGLPWRSLGLTLHRGWFRDLLVGSIIGILTLAVAVAIGAAAGSLSFTLISSALLPAAGKTLVTSAILFVVAALAEEAAFRGYPLQTMARAKLAWLGLLLTSLPFAAAHLTNPNVVPTATFANTALAGIWLGVAYLRTRSLWFPLGVHWSWNWALGSVCGLPVSGITLFSHTLFTGKDLGPAWLTGGSYGIEGGVACTIALILSTVFIWRTRWLSATPELLQLTSEENPVRRVSVLTTNQVDARP
ncbi:MAG TPA: type II CAAX endopeptidase family protein [Pyrinomonadaceae bacterium]|nr:type II CAAX endopeptidase family protein [Pyrinomonadaceae bacterium]